MCWYGQEAVLRENVQKNTSFVVRLMGREDARVVYLWWVLSTVFAVLREWHRQQGHVDQVLDRGRVLEERGGSKTAG